MFEIVTNQDLLRVESESWDFDDDYYGLHSEDMMKLMAEKLVEYSGIGLSAIQIGIPRRVIAIGNPAEPESVMVMFNPRVTFTDETHMTAIKEGCLSFPDLFIKVRRSDSARVRYQDYMGEWNSHVFTGLTAHVILHEVDHLDGVLFIDRASKLNIKRGKDKMKRYKKMRKQAEKERRRDPIKPIVQPKPGEPQVLSHKHLNDEDIIRTP